MSEAEASYPAEDEPSAYYVYHDFDRDLTFRWNGLTTTVEMHSGGLANHQMQLIPLVGVPYDIRTPVGWLRWFQSVCQAHIRMRLITDND